MLKIDPPIETVQTFPHRKENPSSPEASKNGSSTITSAAINGAGGPRKGILKIALMKLLQICSQIPLLGRLARWLREKFGFLPQKTVPQSAIQSAPETTTTAEIPTETSEAEEIEDPPSDKPNNPPPKLSFSELYAKNLKEKLTQLLTHNSSESTTALETLMQSFAQDRAAKDQLRELSATFLTAAETNLNTVVSQTESVDELLEMIRFASKNDPTMVEVEAIRTSFDELIVLSAFGRCSQGIEPQQNDFLERTLQLIHIEDQEKATNIARSLWDDMKRLAITPHLSISKTDLCRRVIAKYADLLFEEGDWEKRGIEACRAIKQGCIRQAETAAALASEMQSFIASTSLTEDVVKKAFAEAELEHLLAVELNKWDGGVARKEFEEVARSHLNLKRSTQHDSDLIAAKSIAVAGLLTALIRLQPVSELPDLLEPRDYTDEQWRKFAAALANSAIDLHPNNTKNIVECALNQIDESDDADISPESAETLKGLLEIICDTCTQFTNSATDKD